MGNQYCPAAVTHPLLAALGLPKRLLHRLQRLVSVSDLLTSELRHAMGRIRRHQPLTILPAWQPMPHKGAGYAGGIDCIDP